MQALSRQEEGQYDPHRVDWMDHLLGSTSSRRGSRGFFLQLKQITDSESLFTALQSLTGTFFLRARPGALEPSAILCRLGDDNGGKRVKMRQVQTTRNCHVPDAHTAGKAY